MVNRWKARIVLTQPLYAVKDGYSTAVIAYPDALGPKLNDAGARIIDIVTGVADRLIHFEDGWRQMMQTTLYSIFEPLARERAYRDGNGESLETPVQQPEASRVVLHPPRNVLLGILVSGAPASLRLLRGETVRDDRDPSQDAGDTPAVPRTCPCRVPVLG